LPPKDRNVVDRVSRSLGVWIDSGTKGGGTATTSCELKKVGRLDSRRLTMTCHVFVPFLDFPDVAIGDEGSVEKNVRDHIRPDTINSMSTWPIAFIRLCQRGISKETTNA